jgi:dinuclear metal center protein, YbgI/SA1388 family
MTLIELDKYFNSFLHREDFSFDPSQNGIQIQNSDPANKQIKKVAFAVDACKDTAEAAISQGAQLLFVHHGLFWDNVDRLVDQQYKRVAPFIKGDLALYASHIPLDANPLVGNNYGLAKRLSLKKTAPFGDWRGMSIGIQGYLPKALSIDELAKKMFPDGEKPLYIFPFGKKEIRKVAIISGGAGSDVDQAYRAGADAYITGEVSHDNFHVMEELGMTVIAGGHYQTETVGVNLVKAKLAKEKHLETVFIDFPTGL